MLFQQRQSKWLLAKLRQVMIDECFQYRQIEQLQLDANFDAKQWEHFIDIAQSNLKMSNQCLAPFVETAECWGLNKVYHYEWASMGRKYCKMLGSAASRNPLLLRKIAEGRSLKNSANSVQLIDLEHLAAWSDTNNFERRGRKAYTLKYEPIAESELPTGYLFDQFGLIRWYQPHLRAAPTKFIPVAGYSFREQCYYGVFC
ncbi:hypothetical protein GQ44DRAFT_736032 [Phaeosphaeriaceae sp. PMI808]|nr:hypothetical protein GQ44DRAFT_736032 [Phaeosphaeriaceae sp. PMI808]